MILLDALGRIAPFHLEFITSADALLAVLKVRFKNVGSNRVQRLLFDLRQVGKKNEIDFFAPWETVFLVSGSLAFIYPLEKV